MKGSCCFVVTVLILVCCWNSRVLPDEMQPKDRGVLVGDRLMSRASSGPQASAPAQTIRVEPVSASQV
jgi:hypothetical protein